MMTSFWRKSGHAVIAGLLMAFLRAAQVRTGFDPATGLAVSSVPGVILPVCMVFCLIAEPLLQRRTSKAHIRLAAALSPIGGGALAALVCGAMGLMAGGGLTAMAYLLWSQRSGLVQILAGLLAVATGAGLLLLLRALRRGGDAPVSVIPLLPSLFFTVFLVLAVYLPTATDPVLARCWLKILAASLLAFGFSQLAGLAQGESTPRSFLVTANWAAVSCIAVLGDDLPIPVKALYLAGALILTAFAVQIRDDLPAKDPEEEKAPKKA